MPPKLKLPAGACDCHFHIFGPQARFPLSPDRKRQVVDHPFEEAAALHQAMGFSRGLLVQSFQHGHGYEYMLHALSRAPDRLRGVAIPAPDITDAELEILHKAGVVGIRFAPRSAPKIDAGMLARVHEFGWQLHVLVHGAAEIEAWRDQILAAPGHFVIEHTGYPPVEKGLDSPEYRFVLECLDTGRGWVKLSPRFSAQPAGFTDTVPIVRALIAHAPNRILWGSDWPHQSHPEPKPADADLVDLMLDWAPDEKNRNRIFVDNPAELFGFPKA